MQIIDVQNGSKQPFFKFKTTLHAKTVHLCFHFYTCKYISWYHYFFQEAAWSGKEANFWLAVTEVCHSALPITVFVLCVIDEHLFGLLFSCDSYAYYSYCTTNKNTVSFSWSRNIGNSENYLFGFSPLVLNMFIHGTYMYLRKKELFVLYSGVYM